MHCMVVCVFMLPTYTTVHHVALLVAMMQSTCVGLKLQAARFACVRMTGGLNKELCLLLTSNYL